MKEYQSLITMKTLPQIRAAAEELAKKVKQKSGISSINIAIKEKGNEALVQYDLGQYFFLFSFPYAYRQSLGVAQAVFFRRQLVSEDKWYHTLLSGTLLARCQFHSANKGHDLIAERLYENLWGGLDVSLKVKYSAKWVDTNLKENCWTKGLKVMYDLNKESILFKHVPEVREPDYLYAKLLHKARTNYIDSEKCLVNLLRSALHFGDSNLFKVGHKKLKRTEETDTLMKTSFKLGYNGTDSPFAKLRGYIRNNYNSSIATLNNTLSFEKAFTTGSMHINDSPFLKGMKGVYEYAGAKTYKEEAPKIGSEHIGDRVSNGFVAQYEVKLISSKLQSYASTSSVKAQPYLYATVGYARPMDAECSRFKDNVRGSAGFGVSTSFKPFALEFYYSVAGFRPKCDLGRNFGLLIGIS